MNQYGCNVTAPGTMQVHGICKAHLAATSPKKDGDVAGIRLATKMGGESLVSKGLWRRRHESPNPVFAMLRMWLWL